MSSPGYDLDALSPRKRPPPCFNSTSERSSPIRSNSASNGSSSNTPASPRPRRKRYHCLRPDKDSVANFVSQLCRNGAFIGTNNDATEDVEDRVNSHFLVVHELLSGYNISFDSTTAGFSKLLSYDVPTGPVLVIMRGHAKGNWLRRIEKIFGPSLEFYQTHLPDKIFRGGYLGCPSPSLPSSSPRTVQLTMYTICSRNRTRSPLEPEDLRDVRTRAQSRVNEHHRFLRTDADVADSIIRDCVILNDDKYVLKQSVTIEILPTGDTWRAIVWLDHGKDLSQSANGRWSLWPDKMPWSTRFDPTTLRQADGSSFLTQSRPSESPSPITNSPEPGTTLHGTGRRNAYQDLRELPFLYGAGLNKDFARQDAFYTVSLFFEFAAATGSKLLDELESCINVDRSFLKLSKGDLGNTASHVNFECIKEELTAFTTKYREYIRTVENRQFFEWSSATRPEGEGPDEETAKKLLMDFNYLLERAVSLTKTCDHSMTRLAQKWSFMASLRTMGMTAETMKLTFLALLFAAPACIAAISDGKLFGLVAVPPWVYAIVLVVVYVGLYFITKHVWPHTVHALKKRGRRWVVRMVRFLRAKGRQWTGARRAISADHHV